MLFLLAGCGFFSRTKNTIYTIERIPPATPPAAASGLPVAIDGIELPPGLDRREIVVRQADHKLEVRGTQQWAALLEPTVLHVLASDLAARLPEGMVVLPGQALPPAATRSISVVFEELAPGPEPRVVLDAHWTLREGGRPDVTRHEQIAVGIPSLGSADIATGMSQALAALADRMVAGVR